MVTKTIFIQYIAAIMLFSGSFFISSILAQTNNTIVSQNYDNASGRNTTHPNLASMNETFDVSEDEFGNDCVAGMCPDFESSYPYG